MIAVLLGILTGLGFLIKFVKTLLVKYVGFAVVLTMQFAITASTIVFALGFYFFAITALVSLYNQGINIIDYATTFQSGQLSCLFGLMDCVGLTPAFNNGFTMMFSALSMIVMFHLMKFTYHIMKIITGEIFKLGVLLGQLIA